MSYITTTNTTGGYVYPNQVVYQYPTTTPQYTPPVSQWRGFIDPQQLFDRDYKRYVETTPKTFYIFVCLDQFDMTFTASWITEFINIFHEHKYHPQSIESYQNHDNNNRRNYNIIFKISEEVFDYL